MRRFLLLGLIILALMLAACGGDEEPTPAPQATEVYAVQEPTPTPPSAEPSPIPQPEAMEEPMVEALMLPEVNPLEVTGDVISAGSSTVFPLAEAIAELFIDEGYGGNITIDSIGSGAGFERFCTAGETDVANASRAIRDSEIENCRAIGREPIEFRIGTDAMAIVVNPENNWLADGVTMEELAKIFSNEASTWADVNPAWPAQEIKRFVPGTDSGTFDYFIEEAMEPLYGDTAQEVFLGASNLQLSEDDNVLVQGVAGDTNGIGFFGFAYFQENQGRINALSLDGVVPTTESVDAGQYPLARPLFMYSDASVMNSKPQVATYLNFVLSNVDDVITEVGYFPASAEVLDAARAAWLEAMGQ